ncbi:MAG: LysR substrate-binding domain-containing protein [Flavobacteriales bacterium]|nr:LysR substrate-binding domain-containing protein [Flavobacteriales bacterium]
MTITQLEYAVALDTYGSFVSAAEHRNVTQPTLSMQIQKLEEELGIKLFDRTSQPIKATPEGKKIIEQARIVLRESNRIYEFVNEEKQITSGTLKVGIIPTIAPYLLPPLINSLKDKFPDLKLEISELTTSVIIDRIYNNQLDCGILATPLGDDNLAETPLYYEPFVAYVSPTHSMFKKTVLKATDIDTEDLWLMNEGHCFRTQVLQICHEQRTNKDNATFTYEAGSLETLKKLVEINNGYTLLPELSVKDFGMKQMKMVRYFKSPEPVREISIVTGRHFVKKALLNTLADEIRLTVPKKMLLSKGKKIPAVE